MCKVKIANQIRDMINKAYSHGIVIQDIDEIIKYRKKLKREIRNGIK